MINNFKNNRIWIIGPPGAGKTTLSTKINKTIGLPHYELDMFFWEEDWKKRPLEEFQEDVRRIILNGNWVIDGYYDQVFDLILNKSDLIVYLDVSLLTVIFRIIKRSLSRIINRDKVCGNNYESFRFLISKDGLISYTVKQYFYLKKVYFTLSVHHRNIKLVSPRQCNKFLDELEIIDNSRSAYHA